MTDRFDTFNPALDSPASRAFAVTPNDDEDLAVTTRGLYVGTYGDIALILAGDTEAVTLVGVSGLLPLRVKKILVTGTTASDIVGVY